MVVGLLGGVAIACSVALHLRIRGIYRVEHRECVEYDQQVRWRSQACVVTPAHHSGSSFKSWGQTCSILSVGFLSRARCHNTELSWPGIYVEFSCGREA